MDLFRTNLTCRVLLSPVLFSFLIWGCSTPAGDNSDSPLINEPVANANGMFMPDNCGGERSSIELLGHLDLPEPLLDLWGYYDAVLNREYALAGFGTPGSDPGGGLYVIDITNPETPVLTAALEGMRGQDVVVWKNFAYTVTGRFGDQHKGLVYDLTDPENPVIAGEFPSAHNLFVTDNGYLYAALPGIRAYDLIPDPTAPTLIWSDNRNGGHDAAVIGDILFDFHGFDGTRLYDNSNPYEPVLLNLFNNESVHYHHSGWTSRNGKYLYINDELPDDPHEDPDISIWRIDTGEMVGAFRDTAATVHNTYQVCDRLVAAYYTKGLALFDISDPSQLVLLDEFDTDPDAVGDGIFLGAWGVYPYTKSGNVLISDINKGLYVFEIK